MMFPLTEPEHADSLQVVDERGQLTQLAVGHISCGCFEYALRAVQLDVALILGQVVSICADYVALSGDAGSCGRDAMRRVG
jgi:hypothetical protein